MVDFLSRCHDIPFIAVMTQRIEMPEPLAESLPLAVVTLAVLRSVVPALASALLAGSSIYDPSTLASTLHLIDLPKLQKNADRY